MTWARRYRLSAFLVTAAVLAFAVFFARFAIERHDGLMTHTADLGQIDLAVWNTLHGRFVQEVKGESISTRLTDHIEPIFWPVSLVFGLWDDARALLTLQALVIGIAGLVVWAAVVAWWPGKEISVSLSAATWAALAYLAAPQTEAATVADFHASPLAVLALALLLLLGRRRRTVPALVAAATALAIKEEIALLVAATCLVLAVTSRWKVGYGVAAVALAWFLLATLVIIPSYSVEAYGEATMPYLARYQDSSSTGGAVGTVPGLLIGMLERAAESDRLRYLAGLLATFAFMPLLAPEVAVAATPLIAANILSHYPAQYSGEFHYSAPFMSVLAIAAGVGATRLLRWGRQRRRPAAWAVVALLVLLPAAYHVSTGFTPAGAQYYLHLPTETRSGVLERFRAQIPASASLSVTPALHPHFSHRERIYTFPDLADAEYVLLDVAGTTDMHPADVRQRFESLPVSGYGVVDADAGMILLRHGAAGCNLPAEFYSFARPVHEPEHSMDVQFGTSLRLVGYDWIDDAKWGYTSLRLYWEAPAPLPDNLAPYALIVDGLGRVVTDSRSAPFLEPFWLPLSNWTPGQVWTTTTTPAALGNSWGAYVGVVVDGQYDVTAARLTPTGAGTVVAETNLLRLEPVQRSRAGLRPALAPLVVEAPAEDIVGEVSGWLQFRGAQVQRQATPGGSVAVTTYWSRQAAPATEPALSVRLLDVGGKVVAQFDGPIQQGLYPPDAWSPGEVVPDRKTLTLAADLAPGEYAMVVILYDRRDGTPLMIDLSLGSVTVSGSEGES